MKVSEGLAFPVVALPGVGHMPAAGEDKAEAARVFYVAATRATQRLVITAAMERRFVQIFNLLKSRVFWKLNGFQSIKCDKFSRKFTV